MTFNVGDTILIPSIESREYNNNPPWIPLMNSLIGRRLTIRWVDTKSWDKTTYAINHPVTENVYFIDPKWCYRICNVKKG